MVEAPSMCFCGTIASPRPRADWATNDSAITERPGEVIADLHVVDVEQLLETPERGQHRQRALHVDADVAGVDRDRERLGRRQAGFERAVDEQPPHPAVVVGADQILDVDAPVAERAAFTVGFGDLGLEGDHAFEPVLHDYFSHLRTPNV